MSARLFVALSLPEEIVAACAALTAALRARAWRAPPRWVAPELLHVTVKFLGNVAAEHIPRAIALVRDVATAVRPCVSPVAALGAFPEPRHARVVVLELTPLPELTRLAASVDLHALELGVAREQRPYRPHVTLARLGTPSDVTAALADLPVPERSVLLGELVLFRSTLTPGGPQYTALARAPLGG